MISACRVAPAAKAEKNILRLHFCSRPAQAGSAGEQPLARLQADAAMCVNFCGGFLISPLRQGAFSALGPLDLSTRIAARAGVLS